MPAETTIPPHLSIYRGQSAVGIGEPEGAVSRGEQFLHADSPLRETEILKHCRYWMTLEGDPRHYRKLGTSFEAWSYFAFGGYYFVVRLGAADRFTERYAYFAHGRAWKMYDLPEGFDPGALIGASEDFSSPWRDRKTPPGPPEVQDSSLIPKEVHDGDGSPARLLARLLEARISGRPLLVSAPLESFTAGAFLHRSIGFARAALPWDLKKDCSVRIYSRLPDLFLRKLDASLVVVPEGTEDSFLRVRSDALWVNPCGEIRGPDSGSRLREPAEKYAEDIWRRFQAFPDSLLHFARRFGARRGRQGEMPDAEELAAVRPTYNLAAVSRGAPEERGELLEESLVRIDLDWDRWVYPNEWLKFPKPSLENVILQPLEPNSPGRRLQGTLEALFVQEAFVLDHRLDAWMSEATDARESHRRLLRILELALRDRPLVTDRMAATFTRDRPIGRWDAEGLACEIVALEHRAGDLRHRSDEALEIARRCPDETTLELLADATEEGDIEASWMTELAELDGTEEAKSRLALLLLGRVSDDRPASEALLALLGRLASESPGLPPGSPLLQGLEEAIVRLLPETQADSIVRLAELHAALAAEPPENASPDLVDAFRRAVRSEALSGTAGREILTAHTFFDLLEIGDLLLLGACADEGGLEILAQELDRRIERDLTQVHELIRRGWWTAWRRKTGLGPQKLLQVAESWLGFEGWRMAGKGGAPVDPLREDWLYVLDDLGPLGSSDLERLRERLFRKPPNEETHWPFPHIHAFEAEQIGELAAHCADLATLVDYAIWVDSLGIGKGILLGNKSPIAWIHENSTSEVRCTLETFEILASDSTSPPSIDLSEEIRRLAKDSHLGPLIARKYATPLAEALETAKLGILPRLELFLSDLQEAWTEPTVIFATLDWIIRGHAELPEYALETIQEVLPEPDSERRAEFPGDLEVSLQLRERGFSKLSHWIRPAGDTSYLIRTIITVLSTVGDLDQTAEKQRFLAEPCWAEANENPRELLADLLAEQIERVLEEGNEKAERLYFEGWRALRLALAQNPKLARILRAWGLLALARAFRGPGALGAAAVDVIELWESLEPRRGEALSSSRVRTLAKSLPEMSQTPPDRRDLVLSSALQALEVRGSYEREFLESVRPRRWTRPCRYEGDSR